MNINAFSKSYDGRTVLDFPGMDFEKGKIYAVIGANGSGKSTLAKILSGIEKASVSFGEKDNASVGYMPQKSYAFRKKLIDNVMLNGSDKAKAEKLIDEIGLTPLKNHRANKLSGGETARMALARLLMRDYELLVLDEPTASMDMESTLLAEKLIRDYCSRTLCTVIMITHSLQQARRISDYVLYFEKGRLEECGETGIVLEKPENEKTAKFMEFYGF